MSVLAQVLDELNRKIVWAQDVRLDQLREFDSIIYSVRSMIETRERQMLDCVVTLDRIASWPEGDRVDSTFDEPHAAKSARQQLATLGITGPLTKES